MYCPKCGQANEGGARFCVKCGAQLPLAASAAAPAPLATGVYAGFWKRFAAVVIDYLVLVASAAIAGGIAGFIYAASVGSVDQKTAEGLGNLAGILVWWLYYAFMESSSRQATLGKMVLGIKVVDEQGRRVTFGRATGRHFAKFLSGLILMIGYLMVGFTAKKQALHDMMAGCLVVNRDATEQAIQQAAPAARMPAWAVVLIVLAAGVFPVGILAAIAIPAYHDHAARARVAAALQVADRVARGVEDFYRRNNTLPRDIKEAGMRDPVSREVRRVSVDTRTGAVEVVLAAPPLEGKSLLLTPQRENDNRITWVCTSSDIRERLLPARCRK